MAYNSMRDFLYTKYGPKEGEARFQTWQKNIARTSATLQSRKKDDAKKKQSKCIQLISLREAVAINMKVTN